MASCLGREIPSADRRGRVSIAMICDPAVGARFSFNVDASAGRQSGIGAIEMLLH